MRTIAHISDLHFGAEDPPVADGLLADLQAMAPSLVIISGDLTQRARRKQFLAAQEYLERLPRPQVVVPGNHDIPLYDVFRRFAAPLKRYARMISSDFNPWYEDAEVCVLALNTARSLTWKSGRISLDQIVRIRDQFGSVPEDKFKILVTHHPFIPPPGESAAGIDLVGRAKLALEVLDECCVDLLLAGHLHHGYTGDVRTFYPATKRSIVVAQAGTAISHRVRREPNGYNLITLDGDRMSFSVRVWDGNGFSESAVVPYVLKKNEWRREEGLAQAQE